MGTKDPRSPRLEVGEVDTTAPFQSVKAAVTLFGEGATQKEKPPNKMSKSSVEVRPSPTSASHLAKNVDFLVHHPSSSPLDNSNMTVLHKETLLHLAEKQLNKLKEQLKNARNTEGRAHFDLEKSKRTLQDLNCKLQTVTESKKSAIEATEEAKNRAMQLEQVCSKEDVLSPIAWRQQLDEERKQYWIASNELAIVKEELRKIQQDFDSFLEAKMDAFQLAADAQHAVKTNREMVTELSMDVAAMQDSLSQVKLATAQTEQEQKKIMAERDTHQKFHRNAIEEAESKLLSLSNKEFDPGLARALEGKLAEATAEIQVLQDEIKIARDSCLDSVRILNFELDDTTKALQKVTEEESLLRSLVESLKLGLEDVRKDYFKGKEKEIETDSITGNLNMELEKSKTQLETTLEQESKAVEASNEMITTLQLLSLESKYVMQEVEEIKKNIEELKQEAAGALIALNDAEKKLEVAAEEANIARAAEKTVLDQMNMKISFANSRGDTLALNTEDGAKIKLSTEEFKSLTHKVVECESVIEEKVATTVAEMEAIKLSEDRTLKKIEASLREIEAMETATKEALKKAEMAEAAKKAVEGELNRWRKEEEQKNASHPPSEILEVPEMSSRTFLS